MKTFAAPDCALAFTTPLTFADNLGFSGDKLVELSCKTMRSWFKG